MNSNSFSTGIQTQFHFPSISYKNAFPSPSPHLKSFNTGFKTPSISIRTNLSPPNATANTATNGVCTDSPPEETETETLYDLLGISQSVTLSEIKRAYKQMALKYHPDVSPADHVGENTTRFIRVQEAYETLSDPEARAMYDYNLAKGLHLAFSGKKGSRFEGRWRESCEVQLEELRRRRATEEGRVSWAARIRKQRVGRI